MQYLSLLVKGSIVVFHNTGWENGVLQEISEFVKDNANKIIELPNMQVFLDEIV